MDRYREDRGDRADRGNGGDRDTTRLSPEIYTYATNKAFLNLYDALRIGKIKIELASYDHRSNRQTGRAEAWIDVHEARLLVHLVTFCLFKRVLPDGKFEQFGGSERDGNIESRSVTLEWDTGESGQFDRYPYRLTVANGPGQRMATGAVQPWGEATIKLSMRLPQPDLVKILLALGAYIQAHEITHHEQSVQAKMQEIQERIGGRNGEHGGGRETAPAVELDAQSSRGSHLVSPRAGQGGGSRGNDVPKNANTSAVKGPYEAQHTPPYVAQRTGVHASNTSKQKVAQNSPSQDHQGYQGQPQSQPRREARAPVPAPTLEEDPLFDEDEAEEM